MNTEAPKEAETPTMQDAQDNRIQDTIPNEALGDTPAAAVPDAAPSAAEIERDQLKDRLLRTLAEMENMRRRAEREIADAKSYGIAAFARDMLAVADNMERAISAIPAETRTALEGPWKALVDGVDLTERDLVKLLEKHGVKRVTPDGEKFDPNFHQAMFEVPSADVAPGTVVQTVQSGFKIGERILRPALVGVAKAMPQAANHEMGNAEADKA